MRAGRHGRSVVLARECIKGRTGCLECSGYGKVGISGARSVPVSCTKCVKIPVAFLRGCGPGRFRVVGFEGKSSNESLSVGNGYPCFEVLVGGGQLRAVWG